MAASDVTLDGSPATSTHIESTGHSPHAATPTDVGTPADAGQDDMDDDWGGGLQSEVSANQTVIKNKPGPECPDNILHNYTNYTYKISVLSWDSIQDYNEEIQFGSWETLKNKMENKKILFSSGGIADDAVTVSIANTNITTANRHPEFDVDFYISAFTTTSIMGMSGESRATNIFECDMEVVEPIGVTLLERMYTLVTTQGRENWAEYPLLIKIEFVGYDDAGNPQYIEPAMRMIPVRLINMSFDASGEGSTYSLQFIAQATIKKDHPHNIIMNSKEIYGKTVKDFCDQFAFHYNEEQKGKTQRQDIGVTGIAADFAPMDQITGPKIQQVNDEIEFLIDPKIANARIVNAIAEETPLQTAPPGYNSKTGKIDKANSQEAKDAVATFKKIIDLDPNKRSKITIPKGTKQIAALEKIITFSEYITDQLIDTDTLLEGTSKSQLKEKKLLKNPEQGLLWWKVSYVPTMKSWDDIRGQYGRKTIIQIQPYRVHDPATTGGKCTVGEGVIAPAMRNYQYIYTGHNIDVKDFGITFNNSFIQSILGQGTENQASQKVTPKKNTEQGPSNQQLNATTVPSGEVHDRRYSTGSKNKSSKQSTGGTLLENLYRKLGSDMMQCTINIVGDPCYIQQDGLLNLGMNAKTGNIDKTDAVDPANGAALCDHQDGHIFLSYKTPTDYNEETGLMDFNMGNPRHRSSTLSGYYRVWEVVNTFQNGEYNQSLNLTRVYNQWREQKHNPKDPGGGNDKNDFDFDQGDEALFGAGAYKTSGSPAKTDSTSEASLTSNQKKQIAIQQNTLQKQTNIEGVNSLNTPTTPNILTKQDRRSISSNTFVANQNAANKQNTNEAKIKFRQAEAKLANIGLISDTTSVQRRTTFADNVNATKNNTDTLSQTFDNDSLNPVFSENSGHPTHTNVDGLRSVALRAGLNSASSIINSASSIVSTDTSGAPLLNYNKKDGLYGLAESGINMSSYSDADKTSVNNNEEIIRTHREILIATGDLVAKKAAYATANAASKTNQTTHGKYGNTYRTWEEVGYFQNLLVS